MAEIIEKLPETVVDQVMTYPGFFENLGFEALPETPLKHVLEKWR
jgi:hypothetical protein